MSIIRVNKTKDYTIMSNYHFKEKKMSLKAKGLLSEMLSLPDDWNYSIAGLVAINKEKEDAIKNILEELKKFNYLKITKLLPNETKTGRIEYIYDIYEKPKQEGEKQGVVFQGVEFQGVENQVQYNTNNNIINNKIINKNKYGEFNNVLLTDDEYKKIEEQHLIDFINKLSLYIESTGKKYKSHYATILNWSRKIAPVNNTINPKWIDKQYEEEIATEEEIEEFNKMLEG